MIYLRPPIVGNMPADKYTADCTYALRAYQLKAKCGILVRQNIMRRQADHRQIQNHFTRQKLFYKK